MFLMRSLLSLLSRLAGSFDIVQAISLVTFANVL